MRRNAGGFLFVHAPRESLRRSSRMRWGTAFVGKKVGIVQKSQQLKTFGFHWYAWIKQAAWTSFLGWIRVADTLHSNKASSKIASSSRMAVQAFLTPVQSCIHETLHQTKKIVSTRKTCKPGRLVNPHSSANARLVFPRGGFPKGCPNLCMKVLRGQASRTSCGAKASGQAYLCPLAAR